MKARLRPAFFLLVLIRILKMRKVLKNLEWISQKLECDAEATAKLLGMFCEVRENKGQTVYTRSKFMESKLCCYIAVVALHLHDFSISKDVHSRLCTDLRLNAAQLNSFFKQAGATIKSGKALDATVVTLDVPLKFPKLDELVKRKRRG